MRPYNSSKDTLHSIFLLDIKLDYDFLRKVVLQIDDWRFFTACRLLLPGGGTKESGTYKFNFMQVRINEEV